MFVTAGCHPDHSQPTSPQVSTVTILVDRNDPNAVTAPCGSAEAVCASITDGLRSAMQVSDGIPTIVIKPGTYDAEPAYPIEVVFPVILKSEFVSLTNHDVSGEAPPVTLVIPADTDGMLITSPDVTIEGVLLDNGGRTAIQIADGGRLTMRNSHIRYRSGGGYTIVKVAEQSHVVIEWSTLGYGGIHSAGRLTICDSLVQAEIGISGGSLVLHRNTIESSINEWSATVDVRTELLHNTILARMILKDGEMTLVGNMIPVKDGGCTTGLGCAEWRIAERSLRFSTIPRITTTPYAAVEIIASQKTTRVTLTDNFIQGSLWLSGPLSATLSQNRVGGFECIYVHERGKPDVKTDGTNTLLNPDTSLDCEGLSSEPGTMHFKADGGK